METFGTIDPKNHTINKYGTFANIQWKIVSSSMGTDIVEPANVPELSGSIVLSRATKHNSLAINEDTGVYEHVLYASVKHLFYNQTQFAISGSTVFTSSLYTPTDNLFVLSIAQNLYGERITPQTFTMSIHPNSGSIFDDGDGTLYVTQSGGQHIIGNIFYDRGIAVFTHDTGSGQTSITTTGVKVVENSALDISYDSSLTREQHQINVVVKPNEFTLSLFNPSILRSQEIVGEATQSFSDLGLIPREDARWSLASLMKTGVIKPYVTSIGLYNEQYELLAVAKISTPIQRTFDLDQVFIIKFDTE